MELSEEELGLRYQACSLFNDVRTWITYFITHYSPSVTQD